MNTDAMISTLKSLKLFGMADTITNMAEQASPVYQQAVPILETLLKAEVAERDVRSINYQMKVARFPAYRDLSGFEFNESQVDEALIRSLHRCEFMEDAQNVVFVGGPGTGKTHLATAIAVQAIQHHRYRVRFLSTIELVNQLEQEKLAGKQGRIANRMVHTDLVILDEIGYLPMTREEASLFFRLINRRYERASTILTSNKSFMDWGEVFGDQVIATAILDRLLHHSTTLNIKGESYRLKDKRKAGLIPATPPQEDTADTNREILDTEN